MTQKIKIEKKASEVIQPENEDSAREAIRAKQDLSGADLQGMHLKHLNTMGAILRKTDLSNADLSNGLLVSPNFYRANLANAAMHNTVLLGADLVKTNFDETDLHETALIAVNAEQARFNRANLRNAGIFSSNLQDADFTGANLSNSRLTSLNVAGADFSDADLEGARSYKVDWTKAKVPPSTTPKPLLELPKWAWSVIIGALVGLFTLIIYGFIHKKRKK